MQTSRYGLETVTEAITTICAGGSGVVVGSVLGSDVETGVVDEARIEV
jgi:hypothetical protein